MDVAVLCFTVAAVSSFFGLLAAAINRRWVWTSFFMIVLAVSITSIMLK